MPKDTLIFHLTRMNHMATSCVGCGMCEQACPSKIELLKLYKTVGHNAQKVFDYVPGRSVDDELPLLTFREEELEPR
jgi:formate dehydrogenase subunit beta